MKKNNCVKTLFLLCVLTALAFILSILCGCSPAPDGLNVKTRVELDHVFIDDGIEPNINVAMDETYVIPAIEWLQNVYLPTLKRWNEQNLSQARGDDCDDYAEEAVRLANRLWRKSHPTEKGQGISIGQFGYRKEDTTLGPGAKWTHVLVSAVVRNGIYFEKVFIEPMQETPAIVDIGWYEQTNCLFRKN